MYNARYESEEPLREAIETLGAVLADRGLHYELVAIGGGSLMLLGLIQRPTQDIDVVAIIRQGKYKKADPMPRPLLEAAEEVAAALGLTRDWLNAGPADLLQFGLPEGFESRVKVLTHGGLTVHIAPPGPDTLQALRRGRSGAVEQTFFRFETARPHSGGPYCICSLGPLARSIPSV